MSATGQIDPVQALAAQQAPVQAPQGVMDPVQALAMGQTQTPSYQTSQKSKPSSIWDNLMAYGTGIVHGADLPSTIAETGMELGARGTDALGLTTGAYPSLHKTFQESNYFGEDPNNKFTKSGHIVGNMLGAAPLTGAAPLEGAGAIPAIGNGAIQGGLTSLLTSSNSDAPLSQQVGLGTVAGGVASGGLNVIGRGLGALLKSGTDPAAIKLLGAVNPQDIRTIANSSKPMTLMDTGGDNSSAQRLARALVTMPGDQSSDITNFLNTRSGNQRGRILQDIGTLAPDTDTYGNKADLTQERSVNSNPLYQQAFASPGVGPINYEDARNALISATSAKGQVAKQIKNIETNNPGALAARGAAGAGTRQNYMNLQQQLQTTEAARQAAASHFENVQAGVSALEGNAPLTDQRLADFMADPDIQRGMKTGLNIQRRLSLANNEEFDPNAYAITGYDDAGLPQVGPVPSWKTLHAGRMGLDNMIYSQADPVTGKLPQTQEMNSLQQLRAAYSKHLTTLNPALGVADAAWSGPSQKMDAMRLGQQLLRADPEQITQATSGMNSETLPYYQVGAGRALRDVANDARDNANISTRLTGDQTARDQLDAAFGSSALPFQRAMDTENTMAKTKNFVLAGSQTANKIGDLAAPNSFGTAMGKALAGAIGGFAIGGPSGAVAGSVGPLSGLAESAATSKIAKLFPQMSQDTAQKLGKVLTATGQNGASQFKALTDPAISAFQRAALAKTLIRKISPAAVAGSSVLATGPDILNGNQTSPQSRNSGN